MKRFRISIAGLMALVLAASSAFASLMFASDLLAGVVLLLTLLILAVAILGVVYRRGDARASWLGFALLGWGYMALTSGNWWDRGVNRPEPATTSLLDTLYPLLQRGGNPRLVPAAISQLLDKPDSPSRMALSKLAEPISMKFPTDTHFKDVLKYIQLSTRDEAAGLPTGLRIYVDPEGLQEAGTTMAASVNIDIEGVPVRTALRLILKPLGLTYDVRDGLVTITKGDFEADCIEAFRRVGHCYWALAFVRLGGIVGRFFSRTRDRTEGPRES